MEIQVNEQVFSIDDAAIATAIEKKEAVKITDENVIVFKTDEYNTRVENIKKETAKEARKTQEEVIWKETKRKLGLTELEGKNGDEILDAFRTKVLNDAKIKPDEKIKEHEATINQLRINLTKAEEEKLTLTNQFTAKEKSLKINTMIFSSIPEKAVTETFNRNDILAIFKGNGYEVELTDENKEVVKLNGEILKHPTTLEPLKLSDVMPKFVTEKGLLKVDGGRGAGDATQHGTPGTQEAFDKEMEAKGFKPGSQEYFREQSERIKNKTLKI